jgi:hypothetical protein
MKLVGLEPTTQVADRQRYSGFSERNAWDDFVTNMSRRSSG